LTRSKQQNYDAFGKKQRLANISQPREAIEKTPAKRRGGSEFSHFRETPKAFCERTVFFLHSAYARSHFVFFSLVASLIDVIFSDEFLGKVR
jgi:hypothetical protein